MKKKEKGILLSKEPFHAKQLEDQLKSLAIFKNNDEVITRYNGAILSRSIHSAKYGLFDFGTVVSENLALIESIIQPVQYDLKIRYGTQELKIYSDKFIEDGEIYQRMLILFSSSNGAYPMLFNAGLFRQVCGNGMMVNTRSGIVSKTKHYKNAIDKKVLELKHSLPSFETEIIEQLNFIRTMKKSTISLRQVYSGILNLKENEPRKVAIERIRLLGKNLLKSPSDAIRFSLDERQQRSLTHPLELVRGESQTKDIELPRIQLYNCYTEAFNRRLHAVNFRENQRIKELITTD